MAENLGAISLNRKIQENWIWKDANKLKWWLDILLTVNSEDKKVNIGNDVFICKRGESLLSINSWAERWKTTKDTARNFLNLLEKDGVILRVNLGKSTRLTVCNYDLYQVPLRVKSPIVTHQLVTNNNILSNDSINIKERKSVFKNELAEFLKTYSKEMLNDFYSYWTETNKAKTKMRFEFERTWELNLRLANWNKNRIKKSDFKQQKNYNTDFSNVSN